MYETNSIQFFISLNIEYIEQAIYNSNMLHWYNIKISVTNIE